MKNGNFFKRSKYLWKANTPFLKYVSIHYWPIYILQIASILLSGFSAALVSKTSQAFIDQITVFGNLKKAMQCIVFWMIYTVIMHILQHLANIYSNYAYAKAAVLVKKRMSQFLTNLNMSYYDIPENKNILVRAIKYSETGGAQLFNYLFSLITNFVAILSLLYILTPFAWWVVLFLILLTIYKTAIEVLVAKKQYVFQKEKTLLNRKVSYFGSILSNANQILDINIYDAFDFLFGKFKKHQDESIYLNRKHSIEINFLNVLAVLSIVIQHIVLYAYIGNELFRGKVSVADFTMFFTAVNYFNAVLSNFRKAFSSYVPMKLEAQNYIEFLETPATYKYFIDGTAKRVQINHIESIEFKNVYFKYPQKTEYVISDMSFSIDPGESISLVGQNGAGKTTLIKLMLGLYHATEGQILINSHPMDTIDLKSYWRSCSIMFQQFNIYAMSAYENITFNDDHSILIDDILDQSGLSSVLAKEEKGVFTELSRDFDSKGTNLSGGEKQKVAFARICYYNRQFLILDEPSSALDAKAEGELFTFVEQLRERDKSRIVLFVSHKLSSSVCANKILFIAKGALVNMGTHEYLMENCNEYKELFMMQAEKYIKRSDEKK